MSISAPLRVSVRVDLGTGEAAGERRHRLSRALEIPPRLLFDEPLPLLGEGQGRVQFWLPRGEEVIEIVAEARLFVDPEAPKAGAQATLLDLDETLHDALMDYVKERLA
ncbi:MAG: hypothetical protein KAI47_11650 [Deltaproteobacteria bacterium]|nr:hypothetical protein [Deltaproteobacteria bacterium]